MSRENFHRLLQRYLDGQCTPEEEQLIDHWYQMLDGRHEDRITSQNLEVVEEAIWDKIYEQINEDAVPDNTRELPRRWSTRGIWFWLTAASIAVFLVASGTFVYLRIVCYPVEPSFVSHGSTSDSHIITVKNETQTTMSIILPDESFVELYPGALLEYPKQFKAVNREVKLIGDAFFSVAANPKNPFWVFHEGMITKVIGTKFKIKAPKGEIKGEVIVYAGKVDVFYNVGSRNLVRRIMSAPEKASITTNQKAVLLPKTIEETVMENPLPIGKKIDAIRYETFKDIPMPALAKTLSDLYALNVTAGDDLSAVTFTGDISGIGLFKQLDIICTVTNTTYEVVGTTIFLKYKH